MEHGRIKSNLPGGSGVYKDIFVLCISYTLVSLRTQSKKEVIKNIIKENIMIVKELPDQVLQ